MQPKYIIFYFSFYLGMFEKRLNKIVTNNIIHGKKI